MTEKEKPKTRWGCIITIAIIVVAIAGVGYLFYTYVYPIITQQGKTQNTYTLPQINKEGKEKVQNIQNLGDPIKDSEPVGRADPFAPI